MPGSWVDVLLQTMDEAMFLLAEDGAIVRANEAAQRLTARAQDELCDHPIEELVRGIDAALAEVRSQGASRRIDLAVTTPDGHRVPIEATLSVLRDVDDGGPARILCVARDASLTRQLQNELRLARGVAQSSARQRTTFLATMGHEIRTPLNGVIGMAGLLLDTRLTAEQRRMVETVSNSGAALLDLINDILDFTRVDSGQMELELVEFDLRELIDDLVDGHAPVAHAKGLELVSEIDHSLPRVVIGDPGRLRQVLNNLFGNAIKFTERGHALMRATVLHRGDLDVAVEFQVGDTGIGISDQLREVMFRPFVQADPSTARRYGGSGLGLAVARRIVRLMGGELELDSTPQQGATFTFRLDLRCAPADPREVRLALPSSRIAVVSDCPRRALALSRTLTAWGARVETCKTAGAMGEIQLADVKDDPFALVLVDTLVRQEAPLTLPRQIAECDLHATPTVVIALPVESWATPEALADAGIALMITKPIRFGQLEDAVRLTLCPNDAVAHHESDPHDFPRLQGEGVRVLVAEDNAINQKVALGYLRGMGVAADAVGNGREAVEAVNRFDYTLVLMDVHMPEVDGVAATMQIRRTSARRQIPIVGLTADARPEARARCEAAGMDGFVAKPITPRKLADALRRWIPPVLKPRGKGDARVSEALVASVDPVDGLAVLDLAALRRLRELERAGSQSDLVEGLVRMFLERTPVRIERMARALSAGQHGFVELEAHSLKSSCRNLGADRMAGCAAALEETAASGSAGDELVARLGREFVTIATILRRV